MSNNRLISVAHISVGSAALAALLLLVLLVSIGSAQAATAEATQDEQAMSPEAGPDIQVQKTAPTEWLHVGDLVTYTVVLKNEGDAQGVVDRISDTLPAGFTFVDMLPSGTVTDSPQGVAGTIVWTRSLTIPAGAEISLAYRTASTFFTHTTTNTVVAAFEGTTTVPATATVTLLHGVTYLPLIRLNYTDPYFEVNKQVSEDWFFIDEVEPVDYTVTFVNGGDSKGVIASIEDTLPAGFEFLQMLPGSDVAANPTGTTGTIVWDGPFNVGPGASLTLKYEVDVPNQLGTYVNSATASTSLGFPPEEPAQVTVKVTPPYLLEEDFETGSDGWEAYTSYWRVNDAQWYLDGGEGYANSTGLRHTYWMGKADPEDGAHDALYMYLGAGSFDWTDYRYEAKVRLDIGSLAGLWVRGKYTDTGINNDGKYVEGYYIIWKADRNRNSVVLQRLRTSGSTAGHFADPEDIAKGDKRINRYQWYDVAVEVRGDNIKVFFDGDLIIDHDDSTFSEGTVGFACYEVEYATWDDILVTPLD